MPKTKRKALNFEILISTMKQNSLAFLSKMFSQNNFSKYNILIINQTDEETLLYSPMKNIRVVNSFEKGLSNSRNLALKNAMGSICLLADDDVIYRKDFENIILNAFEKTQEADIITFQMEDETGKLFKDYPEIDWHNKKSLITANSVVIAFKRNIILNKNIVFNPNFGLGAKFPTADEYIFLRDALKTNLKIYFQRSVILSHKYWSSGRVMGSDEIIHARSAVLYKFSGALAYLKLIKYLYIVLLTKEITYNQLWSKFLVGVRGIRDYKLLVKLGMEK